MKKYLFFVIAIFLFGMLSSAWGTSITYELGTEFSNGTDPANLPPWVYATFDDQDTPGSVELTINNAYLTGTEFMGAFYFNVADTVTSLTFLPTPVVSPVSSYAYDQNSTDSDFKADGDGFFDAVIEFNQSGDRFSAGEFVTITLTGPDITYDSFNLLSIGAGNSPDGLYVAAKIQSIVNLLDPDHPSSDGSGWITSEGGGYIIENPVPEPGTMILLGCGLLGIAGVARKKRS